MGEMFKGENGLILAMNVVDDRFGFSDILAGLTGTRIVVIEGQPCGMSILGTFVIAYPGITRGTGKKFAEHAEYNHIVLTEVGTGNWISI